MGTTWRGPAANAGFETPRCARVMGKERPRDAACGLERRGGGRWRTTPACSARRVGDIARARVSASVNSVYSCLTGFNSNFLN
jgi:hypothetical protein